MATISGQTNEKVYSIPKWLGLNEHPDGDTRLKMGEASKMINWKITRDGNLKLRPGEEFVVGLSAQYDVVQDPNPTTLGNILPTDELVVFTTVSAAPGYISAADTSGAIENGVWMNPEGQLKNGVFSVDSTFWNVNDGVLEYTGTNATVYTIEQLVPLLAEFGEGEYWYCFVDGAPYAIDSSSFELVGEEYAFGGYYLHAEPHTPAAAAVKSMWAGVVNGKDCLLCACEGHLYSIYNANTDIYEKSSIGDINTDKGVGFIPFDGKVYILNGYEYYVYDGTNLTVVDGYRPLVAIAIGPNGSQTQDGVTTGEYINRLNGLRRVWISPDGTNKVFQLPEKNLAAVNYVKDLATGSSVASGWTASLSAGTVTFTTAPARAVNSYEIGYRVTETLRSDVTGNLFAELYSGTTDTRIFLYGDGTNRTIYSGMDYDGMPRADYFPDTYEVSVGDSNTPITSLLRHYGTLVCFKTTECWSLQHGIVELVTNELTPAIYCTPVNRDKGNVAVGQVRLVENSPVTCSGTELYHWINSSYYSSDLSRDERQARRISDRVSRSIKEFDFKKCIMWDDNDHQEFYIAQDKIALVWNYAVDAWYRYENFDATAMCNFHGDLYIGTSTGKVWRISEEVIGDGGEPIQAIWESGAMDFGADYARKYSSSMWVGLKPEDGTSVDVCVETDRKNTFYEKVVSSEKAKIPGQPFVVKTKIKAKKFEYYRLILSVSKKMRPVTVTNVDFRIRQTGYAK